MQRERLTAKEEIWLWVFKQNKNMPVKAARKQAGNVVDSLRVKNYIKVVNGKIQVI
jgi:hypothetical protein